MFKVQINLVYMSQYYKVVVRLLDVLKHGVHVLDVFFAAAIILMLLSNKGIKDCFSSILEYMKI
jgi:hypothetical protein